MCIQWCLKALFVNWPLYLILIKSVKFVANSLFVCLVARPLTGGEMLRFWGMRSMKRTSYNHYSDNNKNFTGDINLCSFKRFTNFSTGSICWRYRLVNIKDCVQDQKSKAKSCFIGPLVQPLVGHNFISSIPPINAVLGEVPLLTF